VPANKTAKLDPAADDEGGGLARAHGGLQVEYRPAAALIPFASNARTHTDAQVAQIAASIREFGWTNPILVDGGNGIIAGHGRLLAARKLGMDMVPVIKLHGLSEAQKRALVIADNKLALNAGWDDRLLGIELAGLGELGFDLSLTGFSDFEILALTSPGNAGLTDPDDVPPLPDTPVSIPGDVWLLGRHRLICGDATNAVDVDKVLAGVKPHLMVTDPPFGVEYDPAWRTRLGIPLEGLATGTVLNDDRSDWREAWALFPGDVAYVWHAALKSASVYDSLVAAGFTIRTQIIWDKTRLVIGRGDYHWQHEPAWHCVRKGRTGHWAGDRKQTTIWSIPHRKSDSGHGTQKPVECMKRPIENNSSPGQAVYEPFSGSGTTIIAAEMTGRACHAIELNPAYVDLAVTRWQAFTGEQAVLEATGQTFAEVKAARQIDATPENPLQEAPAATRGSEGTSVAQNASSSSRGPYGADFSESVASDADRETSL
jgi:DNA modification methylase